MGGRTFGGGNARVDTGYLRAVFPNASDSDLASLKKLGLRWKEYVKKGQWVYERA